MALINFAGLASGIDSTALIEAILQQQRAARINPLENQITNFQDTNTALDELSSLLDNLNSAASKFRLLNGGALFKQGTSSDETVLTASASSSAASGTYNVTVNSLASNATFSFDDRYSSTSDAINSSINDLAPAVDRTVSYTVGSGAESESVDIEVTSSTSAADFVDEFNSQSSLASASLVNVGTESSPSYAIVINSNNEGEDQGTLTLDSVGTEIQTAGSGAFTSNQLDQATNLNFALDGISGTIERSSNTVSDVISGVTFSAESTGTATITVGADASQTEAIVQEFVDAYNEVVEFIAENDTITREEDGSEVTNIFGALADTSLDENMLTSLRQSFSDAGISGGAVNILADLGVTTERDGTLAFDTETFQTAIDDDPDSVNTILQNLGEELAAVDGTIAQYTQFNGLLDQSVNSNKSQISDLESRIATLEESLSRQEESLVARFARLESLVGRLQSQQSALTGLLPAG